MMKKIIYVLGVFTVSLFFSCEPESIVEENEVNIGEDYSVNKDHIVRVGDQGKKGD